MKYKVIDKNSGHVYEDALAIIVIEGGETIGRISLKPHLVYK